MRTTLLKTRLLQFGLWLRWVGLGVSFSLLAHAADFFLDTDQYHGDQDVFLTNSIPGVSKLLPSDAELEASGAVIGKIYIHVKDIFNEQNPKENKSIFRLANRLHINTKPYVIQDIVLFAKGDKYSRSVMRESERKLRDRKYLYDARILPVSYDGNAVDVVVIVRDVWSLALLLNYSRAGGQGTSEIGITESNLLGYGQGLQFERIRSVDRTEVTLAYINDELLGTRNQLIVEHSNNSDGKHDKLSFTQPFYALDTRFSYGAAAENTQETDTRYQGGVIRDSYQHEVTDYEMFVGISKGLVNATATRWSLGFKLHEDLYRDLNEQDGVVLPREDYLVYGYLKLENAEDRYLRTRRVFQAGGTEDISVGVNTRLSLGYLSKALGSDHDGLIYGASYKTGYLISDDHYLAVDLESSGRIEDEPRDLEFTSKFQYIYSISEKQSYYVKLELKAAGYTTNEDKFDMGGDTGVRGYPIRYQSGNRSAVLTIERHYYTDIEIMHLAHLGGAVFLDVGRAWDTTIVDNPVPGALRDVGFGLRLAPTRLSLKRVFHADFAFPMDGDQSVNNVEFYIKAEEQF